MLPQDWLQNRRGSLFEDLAVKLAEALGPQDEAEKAPMVSPWPDVYVNAETGHVYKPHHADEERFFTSTKRYLLMSGGEGSGKSSAGAIKDLERLRHGMTGILVSPDFEHFKKSMWLELRNWIPPMALVERERYRLRTDWEPQRPFSLHFRTETGMVSTLHCGGIEDPKSWEGPNVNFAHFDEARRHDTPAALKVLDGRVRIPGPKGEPAQLYLTTTPKKHWLFDYFGPLLTDQPDPLASFKRDSDLIRLRTIDNEMAGNVEPGYTQSRGQSLTSAERRVLLEAEWEDIEDTTRFLSSIIWWDNCRSMEVLGPHVPLVLAADAGVSNDSFGIVGVGPHPSIADALMVGYVRDWLPGDKPLDFDEIEREVRLLCRERIILRCAYDPYQLHQMMTRLANQRVVETVEFNQGAQRAIADKGLLDLVMNRRIAHDGNNDLRQHVDNADMKRVGTSGKRLVKRSDGQKIDLTVALSMACALAMETFFGEDQGLSGIGFMQGSAKLKLAK